jgi:Zn-dependent peptidase ImmA (M78 family)
LLNSNKIENDKIKVGDALPNMGIAVSKDTKGGVIDLYYSTQVGNWYLYYSLYDKNYNHIMVNISLASERNREKIPFDAEEIIALKKISDTLKFIK